MRLLIERIDVDINARDHNGMTPLLWATEYGYESIVQLLIGRGDVDINAKADYGQTPLSWAAVNGYEAVVRLPIERSDVDINAKDDNTPLMGGCLLGEMILISALGTTMGQTPLISS